VIWSKRDSFGGKKAGLRAVFCLVLFLTFGAHGSVAPYCLAEDWPQLAAGQTLGQVGGLGVGRDGTIYVFHRGKKSWGGGGRIWSRVQNYLMHWFSPADPLEPVQETAVLGVDPETGAVISAFGTNQFLIPHGLAVDAQDNLWLTDVGLHQVFKMSKEGKVLLVVGEAGVAGNDQTHFNKPTDVAVARDGSFFVADGYGNARIVKFSPTGTYQFEWGGKGTEHGRFDTPHGIAIGRDQKIYVADRGNARLQVFDAAGKFLAAYAGPEIGRPWAVDVSADGHVFVADGGDQLAHQPRSGLVMLSPAGNVAARWSQYGYQAGGLVWPHDLAASRNLDVYVGEVLDSHRLQKFTTDCPK